MENNEISILILEDNPGDSRLVTEMLKKEDFNHENITIAQTVSEAKRIIETKCPDLIFSDLNVSDSYGVDTVKSLLEFDSKIPIIVFSGINDLNTASEAVQIGAHDFLVKGEFNSELLKRSVLYTFERHNLNKKINEEKQRAKLFVDLLAHDIRNKVMPIQSYLELIQKTTNIDDKVKNFAQIAVEETISIVDLICEIELLSQLYSDQFSAEIHNITSIIANNIKTFLSIHKEKSVEIVFPDIKNIYYVRGNKLLSEVFYNLFDNAFKYNDKENVIINVSIKPVRNENKTFFKIQVKDNGPGISDNMKKKVFKRLSRGENTVHGSGLGLAIVREIIQNCGGKVWVEDAVKGDSTQGANFVLLLPEAGEGKNG